MFYNNNIILWCMIIGLGIVFVPPSSCHHSRSLENTNKSSLAGSSRIAGGISITNVRDFSQKYGFVVNAEAYESFGSIFGGTPMRECGGIILNEWQVIVPATCVPNAVSFSLNPHILDKDNSERFRSKNWCVSPRYIRQQTFEGVLERNDMAILQLTNAIELEGNKLSSYRSACLGEKPLKTGDLGTIVGLGENEFGKRDGRPKEIAVKVVDCPEIHRSYATMCVQSADPDRKGGVCATDRGAPLVGEDGCVYGMASYSHRCEVNRPYVAPLVNLAGLRRSLLDLMADCSKKHG